jgi:ATP-binding cassette subfamily C protein LapB
MRNGQILLLDEPSSAMDSGLEQHLCQSIKSQGKNKTLLLVTHKTSLLSLVERLLVLDGGQVVADGPKQAVLQALSEGSLQKVSA